MYGKVTHYFRRKGYGFIRGDDGNTYFIHRKNQSREYLAPGYLVRFKPFQNDRSDYNAGDITVIEAPERRKR